MSALIYEIDFTTSIDQVEDFNVLLDIIQAIHRINRCCWIAGGAVRDFYLGRKPADIDLVTDATEEEILNLFPKAVLTGQKFGIYKLPFTVSQRNIIIDLAVFRKEADYIDGRRPQIVMRSTAEEDAKRRDFTINALFYDSTNHKIIDYVGGVLDIKNKILKCVGQPLDRFKEDHLRLLRFARFGAQLEFSMDPDHLQAALSCVDLIRTVSGERIRDELLKISKSRCERLFWCHQLSQNLWKALCLNHVDLMDINIDQHKFQLLDHFNFTDSQRFILVMVLILRFNQQGVHFLKQRIKISNEEEHLAYRMIELNQKLDQTEPVDIALWIDQQKSKTEMLSFLDFLGQSQAQSQMQLQAASIRYGQIMQMLSDHPIPLITGSDLVGFCAVEKIKDLLLTARKAQFQKKITTKDQAVIYIQKMM